MSTGRKSKKKVPAPEPEVILVEAKQRLEELHQEHQQRVEVIEGAGGFFGLSDEAKARVIELKTRWNALIKAGVYFKLPRVYLERIEIVEKFLAQPLDKMDASMISTITGDITTLEKSLAEADKTFEAKPIVSKFDIENATERLADAAKVAKEVEDAKKAAKEAVGDAGNAAAMALKNAPGLVPWWVYVVGGLGVVGYLAVTMKREKQTVVVQMQPQTMGS